MRQTQMATRDVLKQVKSFTSARLIHCGWLQRTIEVSLADDVHVVTYNGRAFLYDLSVDGNVIRKTRLWWFVPRFAFTLRGLPSVLGVRVWPWLTLRALVLRVGERVAYDDAIDRLDTRRSRVRLTVRGMMIAVAVAAFACFIHERVFVGYITQCYGGRTVPVEFLVLDADTGAPVPRKADSIRSQHASPYP